MQKNRHRRPANDIALLFTVTNGCACEKAKYHNNTINTDIHYFVCANNEVDYRGSCPGRHYVRADAIEQVVMLELRRMAEYLSDDEDAFAELLARKTDKELLKEQKRCEEELQKAMPETIPFPGSMKSSMRTMQSERSAMSGLCSCLISMRRSEWS